MIVLVAASWTAAAIVIAVGYSLARAHDRAAQADGEAFIARERHRYDQLIASLNLPRSPE